MRLSQLLSQPEDTLLYAESSQLLHNKCFIGLELELEEVQKYSYDGANELLDYSFWDVVEDGSLRNGLEYKFHQALKGGNIARALDMFELAMNKGTTRSNPPVLSSRTSMHIHVDARDLELPQINEFIMLYMLLEGVLFNYVGYYRVKNNYCRPLIGSNFNQVIEKLTHTTGLDDYSYLNIIMSHTDKYSALNTNSLSSFGSLEFRMHPGSYKKDEIYEWINIVTSLKSFVQKGGSVTDIIGLPFLEAMNKVFDESLIEVLTQNRSRSLFETNRVAVAEVLNLKELGIKTRELLKKNSKVKSSNNLLEMYKSKVEKG